MTRDRTRAFLDLPGSIGPAICQHLAHTCHVIFVLQRAVFSLNLRDLTTLVDDTRAHTPMHGSVEMARIEHRAERALASMVRIDWRDGRRILRIGHVRTVFREYMVVALACRPGGHGIGRNRRCRLIFLLRH